jgi:oryzin
MQFFTRLAILATAVPFLAQAAPAKRAPAIGDVVPGKYIVQLKPGMTGMSIAAHHAKLVQIHARNVIRRSLEEEGTGVEHEYNMGKFVGYSGGFDAATIEELKAMPEVNDLILFQGVLLTRIGHQYRRRLDNDHSRTRCARHDYAYV